MKGFPPDDSRTCMCIGGAPCRSGIVCFDSKKPPAKCAGNDVASMAETGYAATRSLHRRSDSPTRPLRNRSVTAAAVSRRLRLEEETARIRSPNVRPERGWEDFRDLFMRLLAPYDVPRAVPSLGRGRKAFRTSRFMTLVFGSRTPWRHSSPSVLR